MEQGEQGEGRWEGSLGDRGLDGRLFIGSVAKSFSVLELLNQTRGPLSLGEIARRTGLGKSAAQRATHTLRVLGYLAQDPQTRAYTLSSKMLEFAHAVLVQDRVRTVALPYLEALNRTCGETVNLTRLEGEEVVFIARYPSRHTVSVDLHIGSRLPAFCTAPGRAMLSRLPEHEAMAVIGRSRLQPLTDHTVTDPERIWAMVVESRKRGYAVNNQESHVGDVAIGAAIMDRNGRVVGAINIAAPTPRLSITQLQRRFSEELMRTARAISRDLGIL